MHGVSTRKVAERVRTLGIDAGISKSEVSRICADLDAQVAEFCGRPIHDAFPYMFLDATHLKAHEGPQVVSQAVVIATGVRADGMREVLGLAVGDSGDGAFWTALLRGLRARGLGGVKLVIFDAHEGLKWSIAAVLVGAAWQRCRVHLMRNVLARVPKGSAPMVAAAIRTNRLAAPFSADDDLVFPSAAGPGAVGPQPPWLAQARRCPVGGIPHAAPHRREPLAAVRRQDRFRSRGCSATRTPRSPCGRTSTCCRPTCPTATRLRGPSAQLMGQQKVNGHHRTEPSLSEAERARNPRGRGNCATQPHSAVLARSDS